MKRLALAAIFALVACNGTNLSDTAEAPEAMDTVRGAVLSVGGDGVPDAPVTVGGIATLTDSDGRFEVTLRPVTEPVDIYVRAEGFTTGHRRIQPGLLSATVTVLPVQSATVDARNGGIVTGDDGLSVSFPDNAFLRPDGTPAVGPVRVSWALLNRPDQIAAAPGEMRAVAGASEFSLESFGMAEVTITQNGQELSLAAPAELSIPLAATADFADGESVALWHFDEDQGLWSQEGEGVVQDGLFVAEVPHFSWWNCDQPLSTTCFEGTLIDTTNRPVDGAFVWSEGIDYLGSGFGMVSPNGDGSFRVTVRTDSLARLSLSPAYGPLAGQWYVPEWADAEFASQAEATGTENCTNLGVIVARDLNADEDGDGYRPTEGDCDDTNPEAFPGAPEAECPEFDANCDGFLGFAIERDDDEDGFGWCADCDDTNPAVYPAAPQLCDGVADNDCDGITDLGEADVDNDGLSACAGDCDDEVAGAAASCLLSQIQLDARGGCGLRPDGRAHCWGAVVPTGLPTGPVSSVAVDEGKVCITDLGGFIACHAGSVSWTPANDNLVALDGFGTRMGGVDPVTEGVRFLTSTNATSIAAGGIERVAVGAGHLCVERSDGSIDCDEPTYEAPSGEHASLVSGDGFSCALDAQGLVACWGPSAPAGAPSGAHSELAAGRSHVCALDAAGSVTCWGDTEFGQDQVPQGPFDAIQAGGDTTCGRVAGAAVSCWGRDDLGQASPFGSLE